MTLLLIQKSKYGLEKFVNYTNLKFEIFCFVTQLNQNSEPKTFFEAFKASYWIDAIKRLHYLLGKWFNFKNKSGLWKACFKPL